MTMKAGIISLGCPKNQVDAEIMLGQLVDAGYDITGDKDEADILVINTCGFIKPALEESIEAIFDAASRKTTRSRLLILSGCMVQRYGEKVLKRIPEADAAISGCGAGNIAEIIEEVLKKKSRYFCGKAENIDYLNGKRILTGTKGSVYIKISEGCDNKCTYCTIPIIKGRYRSRALEDVLNETRRFADEGVKEAVIVAQDTTSYGKDLYGSLSLPQLVQKLSEVEGIEWIRLLYCYPDKINKDFIEMIRDNSKVCKYLDIPIQHTSERILRLMGRQGNGKTITALINKLRTEIPGIIIRSTLITGFPSETSQEFENMVELIRELRFDRLGVFTYSDEEGTPSSRLKNKVRWNTAQSRRNRLMQVQQQIMFENNTRRIGDTCKVLTEGIDKDGIFYYGRSYAEAPLIDNLIYYTAKKLLYTGDFTFVKILNSDGYDLIGEAVDEPAE